MVGPAARLAQSLRVDSFGWPPSSTSRPGGPAAPPSPYPAWRSPVAGPSDWFDRARKGAVAFGVDRYGCGTVGTLAGDHHTRPSEAVSSILRGSPCSLPIGPLPHLPSSCFYCPKCRKMQNINVTTFTYGWQERQNNSVQIFIEFSFQNPLRFVQDTAVAKSVSV